MRRWMIGGQFTARDRPAFGEVTFGNQAVDTSG